MTSGATVRIAIYSILGKRKNRMWILEKILDISLIVGILYIAWFVGYETCERKYCIERGGEYSYDYGKCFPKEKYK